MSACRFVGRVGGLAVALGVGAALYSGVAVASADGGSASDSAPSAGRAAHGPKASSARAAKPAAAQVTRRASAAPAAVTLSVTPANSGGNAPATTDTSVELAALAYSRRATVTASASTVAAAASVTSQPEIMGPSGVPIPSETYVTTAMNYYIRPGGDPTAAPVPQVIFTPEGLYPITGVKSLPLNTSVNQGIEILTRTLALLPAGTETTVFGYSQSAIISGLLQSGFSVGSTNYTVPAGIADSIDFVLVGNELNPNGGFISRFSPNPAGVLDPVFPALQLPSLGLDFYQATPPDAYPTTNYTLEYDGFADFPRYPLNFLSVLNAGLGLALVHTKYVPGPDCRTYCTTIDQVVNAIPLPVSATSTAQNYFFMPTENLPLLAPVRAIPLIGNPIADLIQPVLKAIVDLGYGDAAHGYASGGQPDANELVPFGLFPQVDPLEVATRIFNGIGQGITDFVNDFGPTGSIARELSSITQALSNVTVPSLPALPPPDGVISLLQNLVPGIINAISYSASNLYAGLLPSADIANAILTSIPAYDLSLFLGGVREMLSGNVIGGLIDAIGLPIAANVGLVTTASMVGALVFAQAIAGVFGIAIGT